ncbi:hypothetical protein [Xanthobacter sediminis]
MVTIYLRFADRAEALAVLSKVLGFMAVPDETGRVTFTAAHLDGVRYDLCFLADQGVATGDGGDHVNLLWWGEAGSAPDFGAHAMVPATPACVFAP